MLNQRVEVWEREWSNFREEWKGCGKVVTEHEEKVNYLNERL
jgi:hypothetical protein